MVRLIILCSGPSQSKPDSTQLRTRCPGVQPHSRALRVPRLFRLQGWDSSPRQEGGRKLTRHCFSLLFFNLMLMVYRNIVDLPFFACHQYSIAWFCYDLCLYTAYLFFFGLFCPRGYCRISSKVPCAEYQVFFGVSVWYTDFCVNVDGMKEGDNPCELFITDTDFCVYVRDADFVFIWEGGARKDIFLVDYLLKILIYVYMREEGGNPCGFSIIDTDFCVYIRDTDSLYMWEVGRRYSLWIICYRFIFLFIC